MGYKVLTVTLFLCLMRRVHVRAQCTKPEFGGNVVLSGEDISKKEFPDGSQVMFECMSGYIPSAGLTSKSVTCNGNIWTVLGLSCTRKSCGSLPDFANGKYLIHEGILFGDTVTAVCDKGYVNQVLGTNQRTCRVTGWDGRAPSCEVVKCVPPKQIENGMFEDEGNADMYDYGQGVTYRCNSGFDLIGSAILTCSDDETFQPEPPKCIVVSCPVPNVPNGYRVGGKAPPYGLNNFIDYKCSDGYEMKGANSIRCTANGWSTEPPQCVGYCGTPVFGGHVTISKESGLNQKYYEGTNVTFECESGYKPVDSKASNTAKCEGKQWIGMQLTCKEDFCKPPAFGGDVTISKPFDSMTKFLDRSNVTFECKSGYEPVDSEASNLVTCVDTEWTKLQLTCKGYCGPPVFEGLVIAKESNHMDKFTDGIVLEIECKSGYIPVDPKASKFVTCMDTKWIDLKLKCTGYCGPPVFEGLVIAKESNHMDKFTDGIVLEIECKSGYIPVDPKASKFVTCMDTKWIDLQLKCTDADTLPSSGLSPGAIAGIVFAVLAAVLGALVGIFIYKKKSDKNRFRSP